MHDDFLSRHLSAFGSIPGWSGSGDRARFLENMRCVGAPREPGGYEFEFDIVREALSWMKDLGNPSAIVTLTATDTNANTLGSASGPSRIA